MSIVDILQFSVFIIRLIIAIALAKFALKTRGKNFWWLFGLYFTSGIFGLTNQIIQVGDIFPLSSGFRFICMVLFIHYTFYLDKNNPTIYYFIFSVVIGILIIIFNVLYEYLTPFEIYDIIARLTQLIGNLVIFSWLIYVSYHAFNYVKNDDTVEDWVKMRYKLVILYSSFGIFTAIAYSTLTSTEINFYTIIIFIATIIYQVIQLIAWTMPKMLRNYFNRHFIAQISSGKIMDELSEGELRVMIKMDLVNFLGPKLSVLINKDVMLCKGLIRFAINDADKNPNSLTYKNINEIVNNELKSRLEQVNVTDLNQVILQLNEFVIKNQSIFTMSVY